jgi:hypothetical protein
MCTDKTINQYLEKDSIASRGGNAKMPFAGAV